MAEEEYSIEEHESINKMVHVCRGGELIDEEGTIISLNHIVLSGSDMIEAEFSPEEFADLEIYINPLQLEIDSLKDIIRRQQEEIEKNARLHANKSTNTGRRKFPRLNDAEKKEVYEYKMKHPSATLSELSQLFHTSSPNIHRIVAHYKKLNIPKDINVIEQVG